MFAETEENCISGIGCVPFTGERNQCELRLSSGEGVDSNSFGIFSIVISFPYITTLLF